MPDLASGSGTRSPDRGPEPADDAPLLTRDVVLEGTENVRDLGGLATRDGRATRRGRLYRSGALGALTDRDVSVLVDQLGLRTVLDLRRPPEVRGTPTTPLLQRGVTFLNFPFRTAVAIPGEPDARSLVEHYLYYLEADPKPLIGAVRALCSTETQPAIFHCAVGKDRTGTLAALLLDALGVERDLIGLDYEETGRSLERMVSILDGMPYYKTRLPNSGLLYRTLHRTTATEFLNAVDHRHGGTEQWLTDHGLGSDELAALRHGMLA